MREVSFHLPLTFNDGRDAGHIVGDCISALIDRFGGATATDCQGYWKHNGRLYSEDVKRITVGIDDDNPQLRLC